MSNDGRDRTSSHGRASRSSRSSRSYQPSNRDEESFPTHDEESIPTPDEESSDEEPTSHREDDLTSYGLATLVTALEPASANLSRYLQSGGGAANRFQLQILRERCQTLNNLMFQAIRNGLSLSRLPVDGLLGLLRDFHHITTILSDRQGNIWWNLQHAHRNRAKVEDLSRRLQALYDSFLAEAFQTMRKQTDELAAENARLFRIMDQWMDEDEQARQDDRTELAIILNRLPADDVVEVAEEDSDVNEAVRVLEAQNPVIGEAVLRRRTRRFSAGH